VEFRSLGKRNDYDRFGNRWHQTGPYTMNLTFSGANNRIDGYSYDAAGNLLSDGNHVFTYDAENRIIQVNMPGPGGALVANYFYDGDGRRIRKAVSGTSTDFLYDLGDHVIAEMSSTGSWNRGEIFGGGLHIATYANSTTYFTHADWLGTERARTQVSGSVCEATASSPFGDGNFTSGSCQPSPNFFTGKERDSESGLDNFGARYDASILGRFMSPDRPFADQLINAPQSWNLYSYVGNNPLRYLDQDGESTQTAANGDVLAVYDDGDLGVYQHTDIDDRADRDGSKLDWDDEGSNYMGETAHWDEFRDHDDRTGAILGNVAPGARILFGQSFDAVLKSLAKKAGQMNLADISAQETPGGQFDIKNDKTVATYGPNTGELLDGTYATARSAGNYLAGYNAAIGTLVGLISRGRHSRKWLVLFTPLATSVKLN